MMKIVVMTMTMAITRINWVVTVVMDDDDDDDD
mgnify:CR=1 FL=1